MVAVPVELIGSYEDVMSAVRNAAQEHAEVFARTGEWPRFANLREAHVTCCQTDRWRASIRKYLRVDEPNESVGRLAALTDYIGDSNDAYEHVVTRASPLASRALPAGRRGVRPASRVPPSEWKDWLAGTPWGALYCLAMPISGLWTRTRSIRYWRALADLLDTSPPIAMDVGRGAEFVSDLVSVRVAGLPVVQQGSAGMTERLRAAARWLEQAEEAEVFAYAAKWISDELGSSSSQEELARVRLTSVARSATVEDIRGGLRNLPADRQAAVLSVQPAVMLGTATEVLRNLRKSHTEKSRPRLTRRGPDDRGSQEKKNRSR